MTPTEALQDALAAEHAAIYVLGAVGARVSEATDGRLWQRVRDTYAVHRDRRDQLRAMVRAAGAEPVPAQVAYELPPAATSAATSPAELQAAALAVESRCAAVYADAVGSTSRASRQWALDALEDAAVRMVGLGADPEPFPGLGEL